MKVFLGGTCNESNWRNRIIPMLEVGFFNPVVDDWTPDCMAEELRQREECDVCLYVITPKMTGVYSVAEVIDDSNKRPARTVFVRLRDDGDEKFTDGQWKSLGAVAQMVERNGGTAFDSLKSAALHINALTPNAELAQAAKAEGWTKLPGQLPEPGMPVLLDIGKEYPIRAMWAAKHTVQAADDDTDWGEYVEEDDMYYAPEGWYEWNQCEDNHWRVTETPRAWMPLPPTSAEGVEHG